MEFETLQKELEAARQAQSDSEFARDLACQIVSMTAKAVQGLSFDKLKTLEVYIKKSLELTGV